MICHFQLPLMWGSTIASLRRSAQELGTHAAMCFGTAGLDPALEGYTNEELELLLASTTAVESQQLTRKARPASLSPPPRPVEDDLVELDIDSVSLGVEISQQQAGCKEARVGPAADDGGSGGIDGDGTGGGDKRMAVVEADAESVGSNIEVSSEIVIVFPCDAVEAWLKGFGGVLETCFTKRRARVLPHGLLGSTRRFL